MSAAGDGKAIVDGLELRMTRVFDAPRELVWKMWTEPQHITNWWGPRGFTTTSETMDVRVGGEWKLTMRGPDGTEYPNHILYDEVVRPAKLVYRHGGAQANVTVTFADESGKTRLTMRMVFDSAARLEEVMKKHHADSGMAETIARLGEYLMLQKARTGGAAPAEGETERELTISRVLNAPREMVWAAWTEPKHLMHWWGPRGYTCPKAEVDLRVGGKMLLVMRGQDGVDLPCGGQVVEFTALERFVFTTYADGPDGQRLLEGHNMLTLTEQDGKTVMTIVVKARALQPMAIPMLAGMEMGWTQSLEKMEVYLQQ